MLNEGERRDDRIISSAYKKKQSGTPISPGLAAARQAALIRKKERGKKIMAKDKARIAAKRASSVQEAFMSDLRAAAGGGDDAANKVGRTIKSVGSLIGAFTSPKLVGKVTDFLSNPKTVRRGAFALRVAKRLGNTLLDLGNKPSKRTKGSSAMAYEPLTVGDVRKSLAKMGDQTKDAFYKYGAGRRASLSPSPFKSIPESFDITRQKRIETAKSIMQQLNEVSVTKRMKKAISKGESPLVAAAKALLHNVKLRGVRGVISPHDYIARTANALQKKSEMGLNSVEYDYRSPNPLLRAFDVIRGDKRGPIGDDLEGAFADSRERARAAARKGEPIPPIAGVEDVKALRDRYLSFANEKWPRSTTMKDLLSQHFGGLIYPRRGYSLPDVPPQRPAPRPAIPPQESSILSINRSTLPGRGMSEIPAREPTPRDAVRPVDILDINRSGVGPSVIDRIVAKVYRGPQVQDRTGASHGSIPPPRVTTIRNKGRFGRPPSGAPPRDVQRPLF